jgi:DNA-directed RNA polymerase subunit RPC12/RpoP
MTAGTIVLLIIFGVPVAGIAAMVLAMATGTAHEKPRRVVDPNEPVRCPRCQSAQITSRMRGYSMGRAAVGGPIFGATGATNVILVCMKCGHEFPPGAGA